MTFPHTATVQRKTKTGTIYDFADSHSISCFIQPLDIEAAQAYGITFTKGSACYVPATSDIKEHDRLVYNGTTYGVAGVISRPYGNLSHQKAILSAV